MMLFAEENEVVENKSTQEETTKVETQEVSATQEVTASKPVEKKPENNNRRNNNFKRRNNNNSRGRRRPTEFEEKVIDIARVTKVVKGGRRFSFAALVVVGNKKGKIGWGHGKAKEVPDAIRKAILNAKQNMEEVPIIDKRTVPHEQTSKFLASKVLVKPAPKGKGIIASGSIRTVVELAGYKDIYTKSLGSRSKINSVKAAIKALSELRTIEQIAQLRDKKVEDIKG